MQSGVWGWEEAVDDYKAQMKKKHLWKVAGGTDETDMNRRLDKSKYGKVETTVSPYCA